MLNVEDISLEGRHAPLFTETSFSVDRGELLMLRAPVRDERTALSLVISGRMKPSSGTLTLDGDSTIQALRSRAALIDAPGVNEPEFHLRVRALVSETLALIPGPPWRLAHTAPWLREHGFYEDRHEWVDILPPARRLELLTALALTDPNIELLVVDSPHRHGGPDQDWVDVLQNLCDSDRKPAIVSIVRALPEGWTGLTASAPTPSSPKSSDEEEE
ncbi:hypothetical protein BSZ39_11195 [Bowdeniella nasicola]|uniref:ABC transporter ATP-binding protein n=1 Tax=Bowdeniella nasicola TaxID=208480 RepID=A0A1Q5Q0A2_9ACTO|nr:hypothetical protein [Bowdeniella nasicola]OKL53122.1 hypothetical protein BSZ39_11195 [Bowdeniella nasicola]